MAHRRQCGIRDVVFYTEILEDGEENEVGIGRRGGGRNVYVCFYGKTFASV